MSVIESASASAYRIPAEGPEADGTLSWSETTLVAVEVDAAGETGLGFTYADACLVPLLRDKLLPLLLGEDPCRIHGCLEKMTHEVRNLNSGGLVAMALSAVDLALWDLKAKLLQAPLAVLLGQVRDAVPVYGSGGFTNYSDEQLCRQLSGWTREGMVAVKMKVGTDPDRDPERVRRVREAIGPDAAIFVDANGAYEPARALRLAETFAALGVILFEEPVPADDGEGLRFLKSRAPAGMRIAGGEYGDSLDTLERTLDTVDVLQADVTRCGGLSAFLEAGALCHARHRPLFAHCGPSFHLAPALALPSFGMIEWFHDHVRIERLLFEPESLPPLRAGRLHPRLDRLGHGLEWNRAEADKYLLP